MSHRSQQIVVRGPRARLPFVATATATVRDSDGEMQHIVAGRSHASADSDLVRRYPEHFARVDSLPNLGNTNTGKTDAAARREPVDPEAIPGELPRPSWSLGVGRGLLAAGEVKLRDSKSPVVVRISRRGRDQIDQEARAVPRGFETGGVLLGIRSFDSARVELTEAWGPGPDAHLGPNAMSINWAQEHSRARRLADATEATDNAFVVGGCWHVHPSNNTIPTEQDLRMFSAAWEDASATVWPVRHYVGVIATEVGRRWVGPNLTAWVVRRPRWGDLVCEPAVIA